VLASTGARGLALRAWQSFQYRVLLHIPMPIRLRWGAWWLAGDDVISRRLRLGKGFEEAEQSFLLRFLQPGMMVLDVGAHNGLYTLLAHKRVGPQGRVIAFEPSPREQKRLRLHLRMNGVSSLRVEPVALGASEGTADLYVPQGRSTSFNSLRPPVVSEPVKRVPVPVITLDGYLAKAHITAVDFVKLDVEGAELDILKGAAALLSATPRPVFLCELADIRTEPWGYSSVAIYDLLAECGYRWYAITPDGHVQPAPRQEHYPDKNLLAVPGERLDLVGAYVDDGKA
jgi:FkbM family methyltransferase